MTPLFSLAGKRALITGSTRGIGRAIAEEMGRAEARVTISSNEAEACAPVAAELAREGIEALALPCDAASLDQLRALVDGAMRAWAGIDILVCNAGINTYEGPLTEIGDAALTAMLQVNLTNVLRLCGLVIPQMAERRDGAVIIISSLSGLRGNKRIGGYGITKAANAQLARNLAVEWGPDNVRVNAISPGLIETEFAAPILKNPEHLPRRLAQTPLRRVGSPREIAGTAVFLASAAGAFITGQNIVVDGGTLIND